MYAEKLYRYCTSAGKGGSVCSTYRRYMQEVISESTAVPSLTFVSTGNPAETN